MVRFKSRSLGNVKYHFVTLFSGLLAPSVIIPVRDSSVGQIELLLRITILSCNYHLIKIIIISYLKPYRCVTLFQTELQMFTGNT